MDYMYYTRVEDGRTYLKTLEPYRSTIYDLERYIEKHLEHKAYRGRDFEELYTQMNINPEHFFDIRCLTHPSKEIDITEYLLEQPK